MNQTFLAGLSSGTVCLLVLIYKIIFRIFYLELICFFGTLRIEKVIFSHRLRTEASHFHHIYKSLHLVLFLETGDIQCTRFNSNQNVVIIFTGTSLLT